MILITAPFKLWALLNKSVVLIFAVISLQIAKSLKVDVQTINRIVKVWASSRIHTNVMITDSSRASLDDKITHQDTTTVPHHQATISHAGVPSSNSDNLIKAVLRLHLKTIKATDRSRAATRPVDTSSGKPNVVVSKISGEVMQVSRIAVAISASTHRTRISSNSPDRLAISQRRFPDHQAPATVEATAAINHSVQI